MCVCVYLYFITAPSRLGTEVMSNKHTVTRTHQPPLPQPQKAGSQDNGNGKLVLPQVNRLHEAFKRSQIPSWCRQALKTSSPTRTSENLNAQQNAATHENLTTKI